MIVILPNELMSQIQNGVLAEEDAHVNEDDSYDYVAILIDQQECQDQGNSLDYSKAHDSILTDSSCS